MREIPPHIVTALANGLQVNPTKRTPTFERLRAELSAAPTVTMVQNEIAAPQRAVAQEMQKAGGKRSDGLPNFVWGILSCVFALIVTAIILMILYNSGTFGGDSGLTSRNVSSDSSSLEQMESLPLDGVERVSIPNLVNQKYEDVEKTASMDASYQIIMAGQEFSDTIKEGYIISQTPEAGGEQMVKGAVVSVTVSKGSKMRELPSITGDSLTEAAAAVTAQGLVPVKSSSEEYSDTVPAGQIVGYLSHRAGDKIEYGTSVEIVVSKGKKPDNGTSTNSSGGSEPSSSPDSSQR